MSATAALRKGRLSSHIPIIATPSDAAVTTAMSANVKVP
jgi:hypothetical protein